MPEALKRAEGGRGVSWITIVLIVCMAIAPFDALRIYIKAQERREANRRKKEEGAADAPSKDRDTEP